MYKRIHFSTFCCGEDFIFESTAMKSFYREDLECLTFIFYNVVSSILLFSQHLSDFYAFFVLFILFLIFFLYFWFSCPLIHSFGSHLLHPCHTMPCIQSPNVRGGKELCVLIKEYETEKKLKTKREKNLRSR